jgi:branched-chain amino acid transport system substrate-binding protein
VRGGRLAVWGLVGGLVALLGQAAAGAGRAQNAFVVGAVLDLKSGWTSLGRASRVTLQLAVADANARLAREGSPVRVQLRIVDAQGKPAVARRALRRLAADGARVVVGPQASSEVRAVRPAANSLGVVSISQGSTAHSLAIPGDNVFRFVPDDIREGEAMVALLRRQRVEGVVPMWRHDPGNAGLVTSVRRQFLARGGKVTSGVRYGVDVTNLTGPAASVSRQVEGLRQRGATRVAVYLAAFDEVVDVFHAARNNAALAGVPWYGSDGVALTTALTRDRAAASYAVQAGYPNPTLGLSDPVLARAAPLMARVKARLGRAPDAFALTAYDALQIAVEAEQRAGPAAGVAGYKRALVSTADGYRGVTGTMVLNGAGDRAFGSFDFWSVCRAGGGFHWQRTFSYVASRVGVGSIVARRHC